MNGFDSSSIYVAVPGRGRRCETQTHWRCCRTARRRSTCNFVFLIHACFFFLFLFLQSYTNFFFVSLQFRYFFSAGSKSVRSRVTFTTRNETLQILFSNGLGSSKIFLKSQCPLYPLFCARSQFPSDCPQRTIAVRVARSASLNDVARINVWHIVEHSAN